MLCYHRVLWKWCFVITGYSGNGALLSQGALEVHALLSQGALEMVLCYHMVLWNCMLCYHS
jgi:hypothetical protein